MRIQDLHTLPQHFIIIIFMKKRIRYINYIEISIYLFFYSMYHTALIPIVYKTSLKLFLVMKF